MKPYLEIFSFDLACLFLQILVKSISKLDSVVHATNDAILGGEMLCASTLPHFLGSQVQQEVSEDLPVLSPDYRSVDQG